MKQNKGFSILEVTISTAISAVLLITFLTLIFESKKAGASGKDDLKALLYLREAIEVSKDLEAANWAEMENPLCAFPAKCHPEISAGAWILVPGEEILESRFTRSVTFLPVYRSSAGFPNENVSAPGVLDPKTKKVSASVSWDSRYGNKSVNLEDYVYDK